MSSYSWNWRRWSTFVLLILSVMAIAYNVEAGGRNCVNGRCQSRSVSRSRQQSVFSTNVGTMRTNTATRSVETHSSRVHSGSLQAWAEEEARLMSASGTCGHVRGAPVGTFVGVGCGTTCQGHGRLVAQATYHGKTVRVWQK